MTLVRTASIALAIAAVGLTLTACDPAPPAPTPTPTVVVTPTPTPTVAAEKPDLSNLVLSTEGLGDGGPGDVLIGEAPVSTGAVSDLVTFSADE
jgi:hypothetical protein